MQHVTAFELAFCCAALRCAVLCCAVLCCAALCGVVLFLTCTCAPALQAADFCKNQHFSKRTLCIASSASPQTHLRRLSHADTVRYMIHTHIVESIPFGAGNVRHGQLLTCPFDNYEFTVPRPGFPPNYDLIAALPSALQSGGGTGEHNLDPEKVGFGKEMRLGRGRTACAGTLELGGTVVQVRV